MFAALKRLFAFPDIGSNADRVLLPAQIWHAMNRRISYPVDLHFTFTHDDCISITLLQASPKLPFYDDVPSFNLMNAIVFIDDPTNESNKADPLYAKKIDALENATLDSLTLQFSPKEVQPVGDALVYYKLALATTPLRQAYVVLYRLGTALPDHNLRNAECQAVIVGALTDAFSAVDITFQYEHRFKFSACAVPDVGALSASDATISVSSIAICKNEKHLSDRGTLFLDFTPSDDFLTWWSSQTPLSCISRRYLNSTFKNTDQLTDSAVFKKWREHSHYSSICLLMKFKALVARGPNVKQFSNAQMVSAIRDYVEHYENELCGLALKSDNTSSTAATSSTSAVGSVSS